MSSPTLWTKFCERHIDSCVPLFATEGNTVLTKTIGRNGGRSVLLRSPEMEALVLRETQKLVEDWKVGSHRFDGLIYCMGWKREGAFIPLYIGKAETLGKGDRNLSANLKNLTTDKSKFARWGDNYAYHIGDLSACVLPGHDEAKRTSKYAAWAATLFENGTTLRQPVFFWANAWDRSNAGVWEEFGPTRLAFLEYLLIGVAGQTSPDLLNREGLGR
jgi:hypothetical protein